MQRSFLLIEAIKPVRCRRASWSRENNPNC